MGMKRVTVANIRTMSIGGHSIDVPKYIHRHLEPKGWSVYVAGIRKYFRDESYGGTIRALSASKVFLAQLMRCDEDTLLQHAQITVRAYAPKDGVTVVHAFFKDPTSGKDMRVHVGDVRSDVEFWPHVQFAIQEIPAWLSGLSYKSVLDEWMVSHRHSMNHIYHRDDFKKFLDSILTNEQQTALAF